MVPAASSVSQAHLKDASTCGSLVGAGERHGVTQPCTSGRDEPRVKASVLDANPPTATAGHSFRSEQHILPGSEQWEPAHTVPFQHKAQHAGEQHSSEQPRAEGAHGFCLVTHKSCHAKRR